MSGIISGIGKLLGLVFSLFVAIFLLWALSPVFTALFNVTPQPAGTALSTYSTFQDATEVAVIVLDIIVVAGGIVGVAITRNPRLVIAVGAVLFIVFLITGL